MLGTLAALAVVVVSILAGVGTFSFWWVLIPAFFAGSLSLSNGRHYAGVIEANRRGSLTHFPVMLAIYVSSYVVLAGIVYWPAGLFA
jgi:hypothetical protein